MITILAKSKTVRLDPCIPVDLAIKSFGGGEKLIQCVVPWETSEVIIEVRFKDDHDIIDLAMVNDLLRRQGVKNITLLIPYFPGARQDRVCNPGEALSVKVYANLINTMKFSKVTVFDPHSDVVGALLDNVKIIKNHKFAQQVLDDIKENNSCFNHEIVLVAPDAGSSKKIFEISQITGIPNIRADKLRDISTGKIIETIVYVDDLKGKIAWIQDDIGSYCGTFIALAKKLKEKGAEKVILAVSHWEGVADLNKLKESGIDKVYTTNSRVFENPNNEIKVFDWRDN